MKPIIVFTDKNVGHRRIAEALCDELGFEWELYVLKKNFFMDVFCQLIPFWLFFLCKRSLSFFTKEDYFLPPRLIVSVGSKSARTALWLKNKTKSPAVHFLSAGGMHRYFDMVIRPRHDHKQGKNIWLIDGSLSKWNQKRLAEEYRRFSHVFGETPKPILGVLIGGATKNVRFDLEKTEALLRILLQIEAQNIHLLVIVSPRTSKEIRKLLGHRLQNMKRIYYWSGSGANPYGAALAYSDGFLVTGDSVNMISEAVSTGKKTYIWNVPEKKNKIHDFIEDMLQKNYATLYDHTPIDFTPCDKKLDNMAIIMPMIRKLLAKI